MKEQIGEGRSSLKRGVFWSLPRSECPIFPFSEGPLLDTIGATFLQWIYSHKGLTSNQYESCPSSSKHS